MSHITKREAVYYFRRKTPADLLTAYGRRETIYSLGTTDKREALERARAESVKLDKVFARLRSESKAPPVEDAPRAIWITDTPVQPMPRTQVELDEEMAPVLAEEAEQEERREELKDAIRAVLSEGSITASQTLASTVALPDALQPASGAFGRYARGTLLDAVVDKWAMERTPTQRSISATRRHIARYVAHSGNNDIRSVTKTTLISWKDAQLASGTTVSNVNYGLTLLSVILKYAVQQDMIATNPASGLRVQESRPADTRRIPFSEADIKAIFSGPVYASSKRYLGGRGEAQYWLPLLGLYTGARIEELSQLRPSDIYEEQYRDSTGTAHSAWVIRITADKADGLTVKNSGSRRRIPIHPELLRLGLIEYVRSQRNAVRIFPLLRINGDGSKSAQWSKWFHTSYLRKTCAVTDPRRVYHSFRHLWKDTARECGIDKDIRDAYQGHTEQGAAGGYGGEFYPLRPLVEAINRLTFHGVPSLPVIARAA